MEYKPPPQWQTAAGLHSSFPPSKRAGSIASLCWELQHALKYMGEKKLSDEGIGLMPRLMMHPATWMKYPYCSLCGYFLTLSRMFFFFFFFGNTPLFHRQEHTQAHYQSISLTMTAFHLNVQFQGHVIVHAGSHE